MAIQCSFYVSYPFQFAKVRISERKSKNIWNFPSESTFDVVKGSANREKYQRKNYFFLWISEMQPTLDVVRGTNK